MPTRAAILLLLCATLSLAQNQPPTVSSLTPLAATGRQHTLTATFSDPNGAADLGVLNLLINNFLDGRQACYLAFVNSANVLYLVNDPGDGLTAPLTLGATGSISNSQCTINSAGSSVTRAGNDLTLTLNLTFSNSFAGDKVLYLAARDAAAANSGWQPLGVHRVPATAPTFPTVATLSPASGTGHTQTFTITYQNATAASNLQAMQLLVNTALDGRAACYLGYERAPNLIYLLNNPGTGLLAPVVPNAGTGITENAQCRIRGFSSTATESGANLVLTVTLEFKAAFAGRKTLYAGVQALGGANSGWQALGTFIATPPPLTDVLTAQYNNDRTALNPTERDLHPANVNPTTFGKLFARQVDASLYAMPLIATNVEFPAGPRRNLMVAATMANTVYVFDADSPTASAPLWSRNLGTPTNSSPFTGPFTWGILSTPVLDRATNTIYAAAKVSTPLGNVHRLFALDLLTGTPKFNSPQDVTYPVFNGPSITYNNDAIQRPGLLLSNGVLYLGFAAIVIDPTNYQSQEGYVLSYNATNLAQRIGSFQVTPTGLKGGIWQAARGLNIDSDGFLYVSTAGGEYNGANNFGSSVVKLAPRTLELRDWFTPANWEELYHGNLDLSAGGVILIPGTSLVIAGGKEGVLYLLDRNNLGKLNGALQSFQASAGCGKFDCAQVLSTALWRRPSRPDSVLYVWDKRDFLRAYRFDHATNRLHPTPTAIGPLRADQIGGPSISSLGDDPTSGLLWAVTTQDTVSYPATATLRAYDASNPTRELYNSDTNRPRDQLGLFTKFAAPVVANGKVYVVTHSNEIVVYGLLP